MSKLPDYLFAAAEAVISDDDDRVEPEQMNPHETCAEIHLQELESSMQTLNQT